MVLILQEFPSFNERSVEMFNTLMYTKQLEEVGITREQAEAHIQIMTEFDKRLDTFDSRLQDLKSAMDSNFKEIRSELKQLEYKLIISLGTIVTGGLVTMAAIVKFL